MAAVILPALSSSGCPTPPVVDQKHMKPQPPPGTERPLTSVVVTFQVAQASAVEIPAARRMRVGERTLFGWVSGESWVVRRSLIIQTSAEQAP